MKDLIELKAKSYEKNYLKKLRKPDNSESKTYVLKVSTPYVKVDNIDNRKSIEPSGGPVITEGEILEEADAIVKYIDYTMGYGYTITFE